MAATYAVSILALAPLGQLAGTYVTAAILWLYNIAGPITVALFTALFPYMVMTGMHMTLGAPMIQLLSETGFDPLFRPGMLLSNMAEGGASLGIAIKARDKAIKSEALSVAVGCIFASVTEPAIYGFNLPLKKPMWLFPSVAPSVVSWPLCWVPITTSMVLPPCLPCRSLRIPSWLWLLQSS